MIHYLEVGHFEHEQDHVRFDRTDDVHRLPKAVIRESLDLRAIEFVLRELGGPHLTLETIPVEWRVYVTPEGVLVGDEYTHSSDAIEFLARVAEHTGAEIWADIGSRNLSPQEVREAWHARRERILRHKRGSKS